VFKKTKSIGVATLKTLGTQYSSFVGIVEQVEGLHHEFESELSQVLNMVNAPHEFSNNDNFCDPKNDSAKSVQVMDGAGIIDDTEVNTEVSPVTNPSTSPWLKKLFKKIAVHCHPDKVLASNARSTEKHHRMSSYEKARDALDDNDRPMMISIGLLYNEIPEIGVTESKKILSSGVKDLKSRLEIKQSSMVWSWGVSEDNFEIKSKILVHAALKLYNRTITQEDALKLIKEYFNVIPTPKKRVVGSHPGPRLKHRRNKKT